MNPDKMDVAYDVGRIYYEAGQYEEAFAVWKQRLPRPPIHARLIL